MLDLWTSPALPMNRLRREIDDLFQAFESRWGENFFMPPRVFPAVNVWEDSDVVYAEAEIPGVTQDTLEVYTVGDELTIRGRREPPQGENVSYHRQERVSGDFSRVVTLPVEVDAEKVEAKLHNGILTVKMPKAESEKPKKITVKAD